MKTFALTLAAAIGFAGAAFADPIEGDWRTPNDDNGNSGIVRVVPCGNAFCGTLVQSFDANGSPMQTDNMGRMIVIDAVPQGGGQYRGKVWVPDRDTTYNSRIELSGNSMLVEGCFLGVCRNGGPWTRN